MPSKYPVFFLAVLSCLMLVATPAVAGNKRIMSVKAAKVMAERALVESVYGLKLRAEERVEDMVSASFIGNTESKTAAQIKGIVFEEVIYDAKQDIAQVTASVKMPSITNIDGQTVNLGNKVFRRVGFATSTPKEAGPLKALRAAELDAYKELIKQLVGFELESHTTVENFMLTSDVVKTKVMATLFMAELTEYGWTPEGDAYVKMQLNLKEASEVLGQNIITDREIIDVEGQGAQVDDFTTANGKK
ncbi:hypothetical protein [Trichloromonas acetexigens]|jgi:hypothetical protein|uniref:Uncharacterized protein n=1 Tax=Trichloromonas acetexigens TaxID=38815 RepID=A0A550JFJ0_9BACT|nr:hypothetical protein [Desulfuromonas acetexigens]TRO81971.1 hypothetical protein FL622_09250 [Desulfuromonas acetexigens]